MSAASKRKRYNWNRRGGLFNRLWMKRRDKSISKRCSDMWCMLTWTDKWGKRCLCLWNVTEKQGDVIIILKDN